MFEAIFQLDFTVSRGNKRRSDFKIREIVLGLGFKWVSGEYLTGKSVLSFECPRGHIFNYSFCNLQRRKRCKVCNKEANTLKLAIFKKDKMSEIREVALSRGYFLISGTYERAHSVLEFKCPLGHLYLATWDNFRVGYSCGACSPSRPKTTEEIRLFLLEHSYQLKSEYVSSGAPLSIECPLGHIWLTTWDSFKQGHRCKTCGLSRPEVEIRTFLLTLGVPFDVGNRKELQGKELDFYLPQQRIGIEYGGFWFHSTKFKPREYHQRKRKLSREQNISLVTIFEDSWEKYNGLWKQYLRHLIAGEWALSFEDLKDFKAVECNTDGSILLDDCFVYPYSHEIKSFKEHKLYAKIRGFEVHDCGSSLIVPKEKPRIGWKKY